MSKSNESNDSCLSSTHMGAGSSIPNGSFSASDEILRNVPPHNIEAEQAVLGGVFLNPDSLDTISDLLKEDDFYLPAHGVIFSAFTTLSQKSIPVDLVTVAEQLRSQSMLEAAGGAVYLGELAMGVFAAANVEYYAIIVRNKSMARSLIGSCAGIIAASYDQNMDVLELLGQSEQVIMDISKRGPGRTYKSSEEISDQIFEKIRTNADRREIITGVPTGYVDLDDMTAGLQPSDLIILAARPSMGKTAFALNIAMHSALRFQVPVAIFSLEMSTDQLMTRLLCAWGKVDISKVRKHRLDDDDWLALGESVAAFKQSPLYIDDTPALSALELRARARRLKRDRQIGLIIIDYLQLMRASRRIDSREQEISDISRNLKAMAKELNVPVIALSQLNRKVEERANKQPMLSDLRESGAIEQDADIIMFIHREAMYLKTDERPAVDMADIIIGKHRNGPVGTIKLNYVPIYTAFVDTSRTNRSATGM